MSVVQKRKRLIKQKLKDFKLLKLVSYFPNTAKFTLENPTKAKFLLKIPHELRKHNIIDFCQIGINNTNNRDIFSIIYRVSTYRT